MLLLRHRRLHHHRHLLRPNLFSSTTTTHPPTQDHILYTLKKLQSTPLKALSFFNHATSNLSFTPTLSSLSLLLRSLAAADESHLPHFWSLLRSMSSSHNLSLDSSTYSSLLSLLKRHHPSHSSALAKFHSNSTKSNSLLSAAQSISQTLHKSNNQEIGLPAIQSNLEMLENLEFDLPVPLSETLVSLVLKEARNSPLKALAFFRWASKKDLASYKHGSVAYNAMARVLGREDTVKEFWGLVEEMKGEGLEMDIDTYVKILRVFIKLGMMEDAVRLYELMMDGPYKPSVQDCSLLLRQISLSTVPDLDLVKRVVDKYESGGHSLTKVVYDGVHRCLSNNGRFEEAGEMVIRMKGAGFEPDNITYSQLVCGLCKVKRLEEACEVLDKMEEEGCVPDIKTWTVLIKGHCTAGELGKAIECLTKMMEKGCDADADLVDILVKGFCGVGKVDGAYTVAIEMVEIGRIRPWQATYKFLIEELLKKRELEKALRILVLMKSHKFPPYDKPFPSYISKFGTVEEAGEFLKALTVKNFPSSSVYLHVFKLFFEQGRYTEAQDLLFKCPHHIRKHEEISKLFGSDKAVLKIV